MISQRLKCRDRIDMPSQRRHRSAPAGSRGRAPDISLPRRFCCHTRAILRWLSAPASVYFEQMAAPTKVTLVAGDVVKLSFPGAPDLNQSQKIRTDGKINLPLIGEVDAAGRSISKLQEELASRYKPQVKDSTVIVTLESSVTQVVVSGAVSKPAKLVFDRPTTVFQAIMEAGGTTEYGSMKNVHLVRLVNGQQRTLILDLRPTLGGAATRPFYVRDGDVIYIPQTYF